MEIKDNFKVDRPKYDFPREFEEKVILTTFPLTVEDKRIYSKGHFAKIGPLLHYLKDKYGGLKKFELIFFTQKENEERFIIDEKKEPVAVWVNLDEYKKFGGALNKVFYEIHITAKFRSITSDLSKKVPDYYFSRKSIDGLIEEFKESKYQLYENIFRTIDELPEDEQRKILESFEHTKSGEKLYDKIKKLQPDSPEIELKRFVMVLDKLGPKSVDELLRSLLESKLSNTFIKQALKSMESKPDFYSFILDWISQISISKQIKILKSLPDMIKLYEMFEKLKKSKEAFEKLIEKHIASEKKDEKEIHKFLVDNYWLLGIEYFEREILSAIDSNGRITRDTSLGRLQPDIILKSISEGKEDGVVIIELEEANDKIFNLDGTLSKEVFDGIDQVIRYNIENRLKNKFPKGIAVIGSTLGIKLKEEQKIRLFLLAESFHNIEILTYDDILRKADATLRFFQSYKKKSP
jgi:hypothetical protein